MNIAINASNLHSGGGIQVAISFIYEMTKDLSKREDTGRLHVIVSSEVAEGLLLLEADCGCFKRYEVYNTYGLSAFYSGLNNILQGYDLIFTVFGPNYLRVRARHEIVGFAQAWILHFNNNVSKKMSFFERSKLRLKYYFQWLFFLRSDIYVVELEHVKNALISSKKISSSKVEVVYNTVSSIYTDNVNWEYIGIDKGGEDISLGFVTRDYPHKNINILPLVSEILLSDFNLNVAFYVTLNEQEWKTKDINFKNSIKTVGALTSGQCPNFYKQMDGVIFPSLLECFSATPLEALAMEKPLFASDQGFVKDVCGKYACYFDPTDAYDIALKIANYFNDSVNIHLLEEAKLHCINFSSARKRMIDYLSIIEKQLKG